MQATRRSLLSRWCLALARDLLLAVVAMVLVAAASVGVAVRYPPSKRGPSGEAKQSDASDFSETKDPESVWPSAERRQCGRIDMRYNETDFTQPCDGDSSDKALCIGNELNHSYLLYGGFAGQDCGSPVLVGDFCANSLCGLNELEVTCP